MLQGVSGKDLPGLIDEAKSRLGSGAVLLIADAGGKAAVAAGSVGSVAIIGSGFIGLEMAVAFADMWGLEVTVIELFDQILPGVTGPTLSTMARKHMEEKGVAFRLSEQVARIEGNGKVERVVTDKGVVEADMVIVSVGVVPNAELAKAAGLAVSERGGVLVNEHMCTSDPDIYAGGDCVEVTNLVTG